MYVISYIVPSIARNYNIIVPAMIEIRIYICIIGTYD